MRPLLLVCALLAACAPKGHAQGNQTSQGAAQRPVSSSSPLSRQSTASTQTQRSNSATDARSGLRVVARAQLPAQARRTLGLIEQGGPFPYSRDGIVFANREGVLPGERRGYYHEYTVPTPGADTRGARRIVCGPLPECYYTGDHYASFQRIGP